MGNGSVAMAPVSSRAGDGPAPSRRQLFALAAMFAATVWAAAAAIAGLPRSTQAPAAPVPTVSQVVGPSAPAAPEPVEPGG